MKTILKFGVICLIGYFVLSYAGLLTDKTQLQNDLIRLHVVANSDTEEDQNIKLKVKDAIVSYLQPKMDKFTDKEEATAFLQENIAELEKIANQVLSELGQNMSATVTFAREAFNTREYETFKLPAGVYDSLRIQIGEGEGENWWCVAFPSLCMQTTSEAFAQTAVSSGFSDSVVNTISEDDGYEVRFFFMDLLGRIENFFY